MTGPVLETERLVLAPPKPGDGAALLPIRNSSYVLERNAAPVISLEKLEQQLAQEAASQSAFLLWERDTSALMGGVWVVTDHLRYQVPSHELEYYLGEAFSGKGYMTEAVRAVAEYCFTALGDQVVCAQAFGENPGSSRVLEKAGFRFEGATRRAMRGFDGKVHDLGNWSLLREEWEERQERYYGGAKPHR